MGMNNLDRMILAAALGSGLALGSIAIADEPTFDPAAGDKACDLATTEMVATTLDADPAAIEQMAMSPTMCAYQMGSTEKLLDVSLMVNAFATDESATEFLTQFTRDVSPEEMAERLSELGADIDNPSQTADHSVVERLKAGIRFEGADGLGDAARFDIVDGVLHLGKGSVVLNLAAFHGPQPQLPAKVTAESIASAEATWKAETMELRRKQTTDLAKAALSAL